MKLYNTLTRQTDELKTIHAKAVKFYTCGPTVYDYQTIGNYWGYIYWDVLVRLLQYQGYEVDRVMNITDVGHLVSDEDEGEDKLEKGAKREGKTAREVADYYADDFYKSMELLSLVKPRYAKATDHINDQISLIQTLLDKEFAYVTEQAIYFDVSRVDDYGKLSGQKLSDKDVAVRSEVVTDSNKRNPFDFALWFFRTGRFTDHEMHWDSPWGDGFPGWHLECSAIIHATLGDPIDIHAGGIDHIGTHHTNEIAQSESAFAHPLANIWLHNNHLLSDGKKISKSLGNVYTLKDLDDKGYSPMDYKVFTLQSNYKHQSNFNWENLASAKNRLQSFRRMADLRFQAIDFKSPSNVDLSLAISDIVEALESDLDTARALSIISKLSDSLSIVSSDQLSKFNQLLEAIDSLLGLDLSKSTDINPQQKQIIADRLLAKQAKDYSLADSLRQTLLGQGIAINDTGTGSVWYRL